jgi:hypothetical protein
MISTLDAQRLVFVDEMGTNTSLGPIYAYSLRGHRAYAKVPRNRGPNTTLLSSMSRGRDGSFSGGGRLDQP